MKFVILEDHPLVLQGLEQQLQNHFNAKKVEAFLSPRKSECRVNWKAVDLLLCDLEFASGECGIGFVTQLRERYPSLRIVAYTTHKVFSVINKIKPSGFNAYVCKGAPIKELIKTISTVLDAPPASFIDSDSYNTLFNMKEGIGDKIFTTNFDISKSLTPTEKRICQKISDDPTLSNRKLAADMNIGVNTLKKHISNIYQKLGVKSKEGIQIRFKSIGEQAISASMYL